jgi:hypothetical protein
MPAENCARLVGTVLTHVQPDVKPSQPKATTRLQDEVCTLRPAAFQGMANTGDSWEYYVAQMERGNLALELAVAGYHKLYLSSGMLFKPQSGRKR